MISLDDEFNSFSFFAGNLRKYKWEIWLNLPNRFFILGMFIIFNLFNYLIIKIIWKILERYNFSLPLKYSFYCKLGINILILIITRFTIYKKN